MPGSPDQLTITMIRPRDITYWTGPKNARHEIAIVLEHEIVDVDLASWTTAAPTARLVCEPGCLGFVHRSSKGGWGFTTEFEGLRSYGQANAETKERAVEALRHAHQWLRDERAREAEPLYLLVKLLRCHDWHCSMSDDFSVARAGEQAFDRIRALLGQVPFEEAERLWSRFAPDGFHFPLSRAS